jgi:hypothetical protein
MALSCNAIGPDINDLRIGPLPGKEIKSKLIAGVVRDCDGPWQIAYCLFPIAY